MTTTYPDPHTDYRLPEEVEGDTVESLGEDYANLVTFLKEMCQYKLEKFGERVEEFNKHNGTGFNFDPENALSGFEDQCMDEWGLATKTT